MSPARQLVEIDALSGKIAARYDAAGAKLLNDVAADGAGRVYVSDTGTSAIWRLAGGKYVSERHLVLIPMLKDDKLVAYRPE